jgi:hypothetical protein
MRRICLHPPSIGIARLNYEVRRYLDSGEAIETFPKERIEAAARSPGVLTCMMNSKITTIGKLLKGDGVGF